MKNKTVFVGLSGGVDSAVSAALLLEEGYEVVGVFIKTWHPYFLACNEEEERLDAMRVAASLNIPFLTFDLELEYKKEVADYMIKEYKAGRTPNPDVMCNKEIKFGAFLNKAVSMGADFVATGHYARNILREEKTLMRGLDPAKDQSYFLWTLRQEQLNRILLPVGGLKKTYVRKMADKFGLPVAEKKDSQGICFLGAVDLKEFLKHYIKSKRGSVLNETGREIGFHDGAVFYTLGERHGFTVTKKSSSDGAYYIVGKDVKKNILIVSKNKPDDLNKTIQPASSYALEKTNWISALPIEKDKYTAQIRYHGEFLDCRIELMKQNKAMIYFDKFVQVASGQSCVLYKEDVCLGGGVVV